MSDGQRRRELGRADRVLPGAWRLRLPLPWPGVPHVNAWALSAGDGIVLVDTGIHEQDALAELERTLAQIGRRLEDVQLLVCTHAHSDHYGLAAPIVERAGCQLWTHPRHEHMTRAMEDPERSLAQRVEVARQSGVPLEPLRRWAEERRGDAGRRAAADSHAGRATARQSEHGARAYRELELAGVVTKRRTAGTYVSETTSPLARRERLKIITERVDALLAEARQMNIDTEELIELIQQRDESMQAETPPRARQRRNDPCMATTAKLRTT